MLGRTLGHYRIEEQLGAGGMGVVYRARDTRLERDVAVKILPPGSIADEAARRRFKKEALALSRLNHPNIATIHDFDSDQEVDFLVMEFISGANLNDRIGGGPLPEKEVLRIGSQLAQGLAAAHGQGVLHRDLKPANLRLMPDGRLKILDFGLARLLQPVETNVPTATRDHLIAGTLPYMAPEQLDGDRVDERADIYAAGAVLYELATGHRMFSEGNTGRLVKAILHESPSVPTTLNPRLSPGLEAIILKAIDKDPDRRYQSARELMVDLERLSAPSTTTPPVRRYGRRRFGLAEGAAVAVGLLIIASILVAFNIAGLRDTVTGKAPHVESLAVLPFANVSGDPQQEFFADGITYDLITRLGRISGLRVTSRASIVRYKASKKPLAQIARELHVDKIIKGSATRNGNRARVSVELVDVRAGRHLWSHAYERELGDVLSLESDISRGIADEVGVRVTRQDAARLDVTPRVNPIAYETYLKGIYYQVSRPPNPAKAKEHLERSIQLDPNNAAAYATLANLYITGAFFRESRPPMELFPKGKEMALKAIQIDETYAHSHVILGIIKLHHEWDWPGAEQEFKRAMELNPSWPGAYHWYAHYLMFTDRLDESVAYTRRASELDPVNSEIAACVGWHCLFARRYDLAVAQSLKTMELDETQFSARLYLGRAYEQQGKFEEAIAEFENALPISGGAPAVLAALGHAYAASGKPDQARKMLKMLEEKSKDRYVSAYNFAVVYAAIGDRDRAFDWLDKAFLERSTWLIHVKWDERFVTLRDDPRFGALLKRIGMPSERRESRQFTVELVGTRRIG
jgi:TolB-like protein/Tfp pilus assembly protein PilF/predicted Ser/Thr protein kinase